MQVHRFIYLNVVVLFGLPNTLFLEEYWKEIDIRTYMLPFLALRSCYNWTKHLGSLRFSPGRINMSTGATRFLGQAEAIQLDEELFNEYKFSVDQLMELAGLSVAAAITEVYPSIKSSPVLVVCGPGNNGGDGIVAARHLKHFGFSNISLLMSTVPSKPLYVNLVHQAVANDVTVSYDAKDFSDRKFGLVVDALFGFSFKPPVRPPYEPLMKLVSSGAGSGAPVASVDIPSGWNVEDGPPIDSEYNFMPDLLISLSAPKKCAQFLTGQHHFLGGRFIPPGIEKKYCLNLPVYEGTNQIVRLK